ncbi:MAG: cysteine hydrolase [Acholeplasmataceae bacterium]|nr:cysteine hydrolase [Acholeplasmataceae bacterium]
MKRLLIVVDFQNDFVTGSLGFENATYLENIIVNKILKYHHEMDDVIFTLDTHQPNYLETNEGKHLPVKHCLKGSYGHQLYGKVKDLVRNSKVFEKPTFPSLDLANYLKDKDYTEVELCGLVSNICVLSNAVMVKSALPNAQIIVDAQATSSHDTEMHEKCLDIMGGLHINVINRT